MNENQTKSTDSKNQSKDAPESQPLLKPAECTVNVKEPLLVFVNVSDFHNYLGHIGKFPFAAEFAIPAAVICSLVKATQIYLSMLSYFYNVPMNGEQFPYNVYEGNKSFEILREMKQNAHFVKHDIPDWDTAFPIAAAIMVLCGKARQINILTVCIFCLSVVLLLNLGHSYFHAMNMILIEVLLEVCNIFTLICLVELVPAYHRSMAVAITTLGESCGTIVISIIVRMTIENIIPLKMICMFPIISILFAITIVVFKRNLGYSLYNLLVRSSTDNLEIAIKRLLSKSNLNEDNAEVIVDSLAFTRTEVFESGMAVIKHFFSIIWIIKDVVIIGFMLGALSSIRIFAAQTALDLNKIYNFDNWILEALSYTLSAFLVFGISLVIPGKRILQIVCLMPILLASLIGTYLLSFTKREMDLCTTSYLIAEKYTLLHIFCSLIAIACSYSMRLILLISCLEYVPAVVRAPAGAIVTFCGYLFNGTSREIYKKLTINDETAILLAIFLAICIFSITPQNDCKLSTYFIDLNDNTTTSRKRMGRKMPPLPQVAPVVEREQFANPPASPTVSTEDSCKKPSRQKASKEKEKKNKKNV